MYNSPSLDDLLDFLAHAGEQGLMPLATAKALAVACRNVFGVLDDAERSALPVADLDAVIERFATARAEDFNPGSLKEYGLRTKRAIELYLRWRESPADFSVKTRATKAARVREQTALSDSIARSDSPREFSPRTTSGFGSFQTAFPLRPDYLVTLDNIPRDLTTAEAERLAQFVRLLGPA